MNPATLSGSILRSTLGALALAALALPRPAPAVVTGTVQAVQIVIDPQDIEEARVEEPDGTVVVGGQLGVALPCTPGPQAFIEKRRADGSVVWLLTANADEDCDGNGQGDGGGDPLFEQWSLFPKENIEATTVSSIVNRASGGYYATGQMLVAWTADAAIQAVWGAFVLRISAGGNVTGQAYFGVPPAGPQVTVPACETLCVALTNTALDQYGSRSIDSDAGTVVIGGWLRKAGDTGEKDVFLARLSDDLATTQWTYSRPYPGDDDVLDVTFDPKGDVLTTGYYSEYHDAFAARHSGASGEPTNIFTVNGPLDDDGYQIQAVVDPVSGEDQVELSGSFTNWASFGGQVITGTGLTYFTALLTTALTLISVETDGGEEGVGQATAVSRQFLVLGGGGTPSNPDPTGGGQDNDPDDVAILAGENGNCEDEGPEDTCVPLVMDSDNERLHVYGVIQSPEEGDLVDAAFRFPLSAERPRVESVSIEVRSEYCSSIHMALGGGLANSGEYHDLADVDLCPFDEPIVTVDVPPSLAEELGFASSLPPLPLLVRTTMALFGVPCDGCSSGAKDTKLDEITVTSDYP